MAGGTVGDGDAGDGDAGEGWPGAGVTVAVRAPVGEADGDLL